MKVGRGVWRIWGKLGKMHMIKTVYVKFSKKKQKHYLFKKTAECNGMRWRQESF